MGLMMVVYPHSLGQALNVTMAIIVLLSVWLGTASNQDKGTEIENFIMLLMSQFLYNFLFL